ncbi:M48 family peptidase [Loktanella sp. D2R18]|uniref:M48 family metallopeptidase n=1 Tax=Rhodobacterales TaxID=204455 RepID=UPI000DEA6D34|nr:MULTISPECIES: SprT family zinc-dependent metalloprotease [Rhodobacterales]MDO6588667.1 SprT family zinc-dependent metalloprotease [Yoonia sp. 1_MG-2023]RBW42085.1 M48 family peptidase [Loktanella sp. D2R18]
MVRHKLEGNPSIEVDLRRSARSRRLSLRVSRLDGRVTLTMPPRTPDREAFAFLRAQEDWLRGHLAQLGPVVRVAVGGTLLLRGQELPVRHADVPRLQIKDDAVLVPNGVKLNESALQAALKVLARDALAAASDAYAAQLGVAYTRLTIRDTRSRWGSCSSAGALMYAWRLIMAPPAVLDYVAAHEVAHLREMNHAPAFWAVVARLCPDYEIHRVWLRENGDQLHRIRFDD